jgi:hypothetical protein
MKLDEGNPPKPSPVLTSRGRPNPINQEPGPKPTTGSNVVTPNNKELYNLRQDMLYIENQLRGIELEYLTVAEKNILRRVLATRLVYEVINEGESNEQHK